MRVGEEGHAPGEIEDSGKRQYDTGSDPGRRIGAPKRVGVGAAQAEATVWNPQEQLGGRSLG